MIGILANGWFVRLDVGGGCTRRSTIIGVRGSVFMLRFVSVVVVRGRSCVRSFRRHSHSQSNQTSGATSSNIYILV